MSKGLLYGYQNRWFQNRLDQDPQAMRRRRETVEHPFGTIKARKALKDKGVKKADSEAVLAAIRAVYTG